MKLAPRFGIGARYHSRVRFWINMSSSRSWQQIVGILVASEKLWLIWSFFVYVKYSFLFIIYVLEKSFQGIPHNRQSYTVRILQNLCPSVLMLLICSLSPALLIILSHYKSHLVVQEEKGTQADIIWPVPVEYTDKGYFVQLNFNFCANVLHWNTKNCFNCVVYPWNFSYSSVWAIFMMSPKHEGCLRLLHS
jgi:hypothetical protein